VRDCARPWSLHNRPVLIHDPEVESVSDVSEYPAPPPSEPLKPPVESSTFPSIPESPKPRRRKKKKNREEPSAFEGLVELVLSPFL